jgi:hypothetical protein
MPRPNARRLLDELYQGRIHGFLSLAADFDDATAAVKECVGALREALR